MSDNNIGRDYARYCKLDASLFTSPQYPLMLKWREDKLREDMLARMSKIVPEPTMPRIDSLIKQYAENIVHAATTEGESYISPVLGRSYSELSEEMKEELNDVLDLYGAGILAVVPRRREYAVISILGCQRQAIAEILLEKGITETTATTEEKPVKLKRIEHISDLIHEGLSDKQVDDLCTYHNNPSNIPKYEAINEAVKELIRTIQKHCPECSMRTQAVHSAIVVRMQANAAIALPCVEVDDE